MNATLKPIKIVHLITELNTGGAEQMLHKLVTRMDPRAFSPLVVSMAGRGPVGERLAADGVPVLELGMRLGRPNPAGLLKFCRLLRKEKPDVLQTWLYHADLLGLIAGKASAVKRIVWGIRCSDMDLRNYSPLTALTVWSSARLSRFPHAILVNSEKGKEVHEKRGYSTRRMTVIPNGFDIERFRPDAAARAWLIEQLGLRQEDSLIGFVARFDPMKDHATFFRAASSLAAAEDSVHFVLAGDGMAASNAQVTALMDSGIRDKVHLLGRREDVPRLLAAMDIATSASAYGEGFSNAVGEAMACGVPCVVTDVGDAGALVGDTGVVIPPRSPGRLAEAWARLLGMGEEQRKRLGEAGRARVLERYEIGAVVRRFETFYTELQRAEG
ncbi:MAG: glycosyltransferase [Desulfobacterota bacterium]|jgi:glycosyltransferase involved in cell wall biosynthesis|nr:glycosyltransferase [Thermodesulfobacteriota bacterium]